MRSHCPTSARSRSRLSRTIKNQELERSRLPNTLLYWAIFIVLIYVPLTTGQTTTSGFWKRSKKFDREMLFSLDNKTVEINTPSRILCVAAAQREKWTNLACFSNTTNQCHISDLAIPMADGPEEAHDECYTRLTATTEMTKTCPGCFQYVEEYSGYLHISPGNNYTWYDARDYCSSLGGRLWSSPEHFEKLKKHLKDTETADLWVGLKYHPSGAFVWLTNEVADRDGDQRWKGWKEENTATELTSDQGGNASTGLYCVRLIGGNDFLAAASLCLDFYRALCEKIQ